jgi:hypothetical protein
MLTAGVSRRAANARTLIEAAVIAGDDAPAEATESR